MQHSMKCLRSVALCFVVLSAALPVLAQETPKAEFSGGYQLLNYSAAGNLASLTFFRSWYLDVAGSVNKVVSIAGEAGGAYKNETQTIFGFSQRVDLNTHELMGGIRLNARQPHVVSFGQVLVGGVQGGSRVSVSGQGFSDSNSGSSTHFALQAGGGVNVLATDKVGVRIGADYLRIFPKNEETTRQRVPIRRGDRATLREEVGESPCV